MTDNRHKGLLISFFSMELFWLFAWADFLMTSTAGLVIPFIPFLTAYFLSFSLAGSFRKKGLRLIWVILGHAFMLSVAAAFAVWRATGRVFPPGADIFQWYRFFLTGAVTGLFWYKGTKLCFRQMSYKMVCNYFDLGLALFFTLLLIKLLVFYQSGVRLAEAFFLYLLVGFFFTGLAAIFFSNISTTHKKHYIEGFRGVGVMISFTMVFLLCSLGLVYVLMPVMTSMAESGYTVLKQVSGPLGPYLVSVLRFILVAPKSRGKGASTHQGQGIEALHDTGMTGEAGWFSELLFWPLLVLIVSAGLILVAILIFRVFRLLMQKPLPGPGVVKTRSLWSGFRRFLGVLLNYPGKLIFIFFSKIETAQKGFSRLMAWGRKSGVKRHLTETPMEYAKRLQDIFLPLENEILTIVHAFHLETYGEIKLTGLEISRMKKALKKIHSPSFWFMRLKAGIKRV